MRKSVLLLGFSLTASLATAAPATAFAQTSTDPVAARTLFQEARKLVLQGKYELACPKFEESLNLDSGIGTMFNLADCLEHTGRTASAWSRFLDTASAAKNAGQGERERVARSRAAALEPHLSRLTVAVVAADPGLEVHDGARAVASSLFGVAVPVDPGAHTIDAKAPGKKAWHDVVQVGPEGAQITVNVPALAVDDTAPPPVVSVAPVVAVPAGTGGERTAPDTAPSSAGRTQRIAGWITAGVGVAGVAVGTVFGLVTTSKNNQAKGLCPTTFCSTEAQLDQHASLVDSARSARTGSIIGFAVGGVALVSGATLLLTAPSAHREALRLAPVVGLGLLGVSAAGDW
jgi:hypothetical protein